MSEEISTADANLAEIARLRAENAELRAELLRRAEMDAEDMHRIQVRYDHLYRQFESLQTQVARGMTIKPPPTIYVDSDVPALLAELEAARADNAALRPEVRAFAGLMEAKLRANDHKPGWKQDDPYALYRRLCEEVAELRAVLVKPFAVADETADVANFAMMIADVCGWLVVPTDHPGAALLAELEAARAVVAVVRWAVKEHYAPPPMCDALSAYDEAMEARPT